MIRIAVCDDDQATALSIREMIEDARLIFDAPKRLQTDCFTDASDMLSADVVYDIYFLDVQMPAISGVELARAIRKRSEDAAIVFVTALKEYVFDAFDVGALHYLVKPVDKEKFKEVLLRAIDACEDRRADDERFFLIKTKEKRLRFKTSEILSVESRGRKLLFDTTRGVFETYGALRRTQPELGADFYRCHRSYLVNMAHITAYENDTIALDNGSVVYLARERYGDFVKSYLRFLRHA